MHNNAQQIEDMNLEYQISIHNCFMNIEYKIRTFDFSCMVTIEVDVVYNQMAILGLSKYLSLICTHNES